jgi:hypothetical protein
LTLQWTNPSRQGLAETATMSSGGLLLKPRSFFTCHHLAPGKENEFKQFFLWRL